MSGTSLISQSSEIEIFHICGADESAVALLNGYMRLRKSVFIDGLKWPRLEDVNGAEVDEYDGSHTDYIIAVSRKTKEVIGGVRINPTTLDFQACPLSNIKISYMIRDACLGRIGGIHPTILKEPPPQSERIVEATRLIAGNHKQLKELLLATDGFLRGRNIEQCLFLTHPMFSSFGKRLGFDPVPLGPVHGEGKARMQAFSYSPAKDAG